MVAVDPLVGRAEELAVVGRVLVDDGVRALVIAGAAGVGKTRLAREALACAERGGRTSFWVAASQAAATIPFGAVAHLVPDLDSTDRLQILRRVGLRLAAATGGPAVLGVDDAQHLDDASATLVHHLAATGAAFVVATVRTGEPAPGPVTALWKDGLGERIELQPLSRSETVALVAALLAGPITALAQDELWRLSQGNALYLRELVRAGLAAGVLVSTGGVWCWSEQVAGVPRLAALVTDRIGEQTSDVREVVDLVAFGEPLGVNTLERAGVSVATIESAEHTGMVRTEPARRDIDVWLAHPLFGELARARASSLRRREICRQLARATADSDHAEDAIRKAVWHLDGGIVTEPGVLTVGAARALAALDLLLAQRLAAAAVRAGGGADADRILATAHMLCGDGHQAETVLARLDTTGLPDLAVARLGAARAWNLVFALGRPAAAEAVLTTTHAAIAGGRELLAQQRACFLAYAGQPTPALAAAAAVVERSGTDPEAMLGALTVTCHALAVLGRYVDAVRAGERAVELAGSLHGDDWSMLLEEVLGGLVGANLYAGRLDKAQALVDNGRQRSMIAGWRMGIAVWLVWQGDVAMARGAARTALHHFTEAAALLDASTHPYRGWTVRLLSIHRAHAAALLGEVAEATAALRLADELARPWLGVLDVWGGSCAAWVAVARGEVSAGIKLALAAADRARRDDQFGWEIIARHQVVRFGAPELVVARLAELKRCVDGPLAPLYAAQAGACVDADGARLDDVSSAFADLGYLLLAAEACAQAAHSHRAAGLLGSAATSTSRARELASLCEVAQTPALALLTEPSGLTRRENEIARLAASGLTSQKIADTLVISIRTVDNTLHQVYAKLGVTGRRDLSQVLDP